MDEERVNEVADRHLQKAPPVKLHVLLSNLSLLNSAYLKKKKNEMYKICARNDKICQFVRGPNEGS